MRRLSLVIVFVGVLGLMGLAPVAYGGHADPDKFPIDHPNIEHEHSPAPNRPPADDDLTATCLVLGAIEIGDSYGNGGISLNPAIKNHNHYELLDSTFDCLSADAPFNRPFDVFAAGGTDGQGGQQGVGCDGNPNTKDTQCLDTHHGENLSVGWSHSSCYDDQLPKGPGGCGPFSSAKRFLIFDLYDGTNENPEGSGQCTNCGEIAVRSVDGFVTSLSTDNWVKFCRGRYDEDIDKNGLPDLPTSCTNALNDPGTGVQLHTSRGGANVLAWGALTIDQPGIGIVCFLANVEFTPKPGSPNAQNKINGGSFVGDALLWTVPNKDDCEGTKKPKP